MSDPTLEAQAITAPDGPPPAMRAFFAVWLWLTVNSEFLSIDTKDGTTSVVTNALESDDLATFVAALTPMVTPVEGQDPKDLVTQALANILNVIQTGSTDDSLLVMPTAGGDPIGATVNYGTLLRMTRMMFQDVAGNAEVALPYDDPDICARIKFVSGMVSS